MHMAGGWMRLVRPILESEGQITGKPCRCASLPPQLRHNPFQQLPRIDDRCLPPLLRKMTLVAGDQEVRSGRFGAFQEAVICGFARGRQFVLRRNDLALASNQSQGRAHLPRSKVEFGAAKHGFILVEDRIGNREPQPPIECKVENGAFVSLVVNVC